MATTKTITMAIPHENASNEVIRWNFEMKYENGNEGDAGYFNTIFCSEATVENSDFVAAGKGTFTLANLIALCPTSQWDITFANQIEDRITNPPIKPTADLSFTVPTE